MRRYEVYIGASFQQTGVNEKETKITYHFSIVGMHVQRKWRIIIRSCPMWNVFFTPVLSGPKRCVGMSSKFEH